jgi:D-alanine transaminase/branched-chain amino acid aminotransferase
LIGQLATLSEDSCLGVKMVLTGGDSLNGFEPMEGKSNLFIFPGVFSFANPLDGMHLISQKYHREMADIKSLNYAFAIRHWANVKSKGGNDLLYYTDELGVSESSRSNLFFVKSGVIYTPGQQILEGITRSHVLTLAAKEFEVQVGDYSLAEFLSADEVFTTGSTKRVLPIFSIDGKQINGAKRGPITSHLYDLLVASEC